ncbi:MAG: polysaccharide deacetylase family protein [Fulvivirga sp.]
MMLHKTPRLIQWLYPSLTWKKNVSDNSIYLTFDDGPIPGLTEYILDELKRFDVKATFFCVGDNLRKHPQIAQRALSEGHRLGNHSYNHLNGWQTNTLDYVSNVVRCQRELYDLHNPEPQLLRPPYGKIKRSQIKHLKEKYEIIMWDVLSGDFLPTISPEKCLSKSISSTKPGSIIIFHDNIKAEKNVRYALPRYIEHFKNQGYSFQTL